MQRWEYRVIQKLTLGTGGRKWAGFLDLQTGRLLNVAEETARKLLDVKGEVMKDIANQSPVMKELLISEDAEFMRELDATVLSMVGCDPVLLNEWGKEGWELIAYSDGALVFKRPR